MSQSRITFTARSSADLVALVPQVLGFHPRDSVVLMTFGRTDNFQARVDLPAGEDDQLAVVAMLAEVITRHRARQVALLLYTEDAWVAASFHDAAVARLVRDGVEVVDVLRVAHDRYHAAGDPHDQGEAYDLTAHRFTAEQVVRGQVVHKSREQLAASLRFVDAEDARAVAAAVDRLGEESSGLAQLISASRTSPDLADQGLWIQRTVRRHVGRGTRLPAEDAGRLLLLVSASDLRDVALAEMTRDNAAGHAELWRDLVRRCPSRLLPAASTLLAFAAWLSGHGALAWCALDRCAEVDDHYPLAACIGDLMESAVPPSAWTGIPAADLPVFWSLPPDAG
jgi:hypothetical protein